MDKMFGDIVSIILIVPMFIKGGYYFYKLFDQSDLETNLMTLREKYISRTLLLLYLSITYAISIYYSKSVINLITARISENLNDLISSSLMIITICLSMIVLYYGKRIDQKVEWIPNLINFTSYKEFNNNLREIHNLVFRYFITSLLLVSSFTFMIISSYEIKTINNNYKILLNIIFLSVMMIIFNLIKIFKVSRLKLPILMDVEIDNVIRFKDVIILRNSDEMYYARNYYNNQEFAIAKGQNIVFYKKDSELYLKACDQIKLIRNNNHMIDK